MVLMTLSPSPLALDPNTQKAPLVAFVGSSADASLLPAAAASDAWLPAWSCHRTPRAEVREEGTAADLSVASGEGAGEGAA